MSASRVLGIAAAFGLGAACVPVGALAQVAVQHIGLLLTVSHASSQPGPIDPNETALHRALLREFRYESLRVLARHHMDLRMQEVGGIELPTGQKVLLRPLSLSPAGVLISVDIPGTLQTDLRVSNRRQVVIGVEHFEDGKLILTLQPDY